MIIIGGVDTRWRRCDTEDASFFQVLVGNFGRAQPPGGRYHGEGGAPVDRSQVMLHVGVHIVVGVSKFGGAHRVRRQADQGDVGDDGASAQAWRAVNGVDSVALIVISALLVPDVNRERRVECREEMSWTS